MGELTRADFPTAFNGGFRPALTLRRCPQCRSRTISLTEFVSASTTFEVAEGLINREGGIHEFGDFVGNVRGECRKCAHTWTLKGASNLDHVVKDLDRDTIKAKGGE